METQNFWSQLAARLTSNTPIFFKRFVMFGISLGAVGLAILGIGATPVPIPHFLTVMSSYFVTAGAVCTAVAKATTTDPTLQAQGGSNAVVNQSANPPGKSTEAPVSPPIPEMK